MASLEGVEKYMSEKAETVTKFWSTKIDWNDIKVDRQLKNTKDKVDFYPFLDRLTNKLSSAVVYLSYLQE